MITMCLYGNLKITLNVMNYKRLNMKKTKLTKNDKEIIQECRTGKSNSLYMYYQYLIQKCCACQKNTFINN